MSERRRSAASATRTVLQGDAGRWLAAHAPQRARRWPAGETHALDRGDDSAPRALVRLAPPEPGEGHHREHVRHLHGAGDAFELAELLAAVVARADARFRLEAETPSLDSPWRRALAASPLEREVELPEAWRPVRAAQPVALELWGRPALLRGRPALLRGRPALLRGRLASGWSPGGAEAASGVAGCDLSLAGGIRLVARGEGTRAALAAFLDALVPGRAYPPGALLTDAERVETRRPGDLDAPWLLALEPGGAVVGGVVLERGGRPERSHVRRVHVDVATEWRGRGIATALLAEARRGASRLAGAPVLRVEADPRSGNDGVVRCLRRAGFIDCGAQRGAWRMRTAATRWDEDLLFLSAVAE